VTAGIPGAALSGAPPSDPARKPGRRLGPATPPSSDGPARTGAFSIRPRSRAYVIIRRRLSKRRAGWRVRRTGEYIGLPDVVLANDNDPACRDYDRAS